MPPLKLFVSHSSRLDDVPHKWTDDDRNWKLLGDTCKAIREHYGNKVDVLVDKDGLVPGDDWNHRLNLWLAECHAAIILFSKRAIEKSQWVAKEAAILSWRAELDDKFILIPVLLDGETETADLTNDFLGTLQIGRFQGIPSAENAEDILEGLKAKLESLESWPSKHPQTPLDRLRGGVAKLLSDNITPTSLEAALEQAGSAEATDPKQFPDALARALISTTADNPLEVFNLFQKCVDQLDPKPNRQLIERLFESIRSFWVEPRSASCLPLGLQRKQPVVMNGGYINKPVPDLGVQTGYTLERYIERAWVSSTLAFNPVQLTQIDDLEQMKSEIRRQFFNPFLLSQRKPEKLDSDIDGDPKKIFVIVSSDQFPDPRQLAELSLLAKVYKNILVIIHSPGNGDPLAADCRLIHPPVDTDLEEDALSKEWLTMKFIEKFK